MNHEEYIEYLKKKVHDKFFSSASESKANERYIHSLGVSKVAGTLASIYKPGDESFKEKCEIAGILHDYGKFLNRDDYYILTKRHHIDFEYNDDYRLVYHGYYGYLAVSDDLGIHDKEILNAIKNHIMGAQVMTLIEEIIYVGDLIEENRNVKDIPIVEELRDLAFNGKLKAAVALESQHTIMHLSEKMIPINPLSLDCYNGYIKYLKEEN